MQGSRRGSGGSALAKELGISPAAVTQHMQKGRTFAQIRELVQRREDRGGKKRGPQSKLMQGAQVAQGVHAPYVPKKRRTASRVGTTGVPDEQVEIPVQVDDEHTPETFTQAQTRKEIALADDRELTVARTRGEVVPTSLVNSHFAGVFIKARDMAIQIGPMLADRLAVETDAGKCAQLVEKEVRRVLGVLKLMDGTT